ncbi:MAG: signal recognition particle subunit SRP19/SEC65 family protein [Candidatus Methanomethylicaceae archaeon]|jgi:signal recognition particle subunit SRP19
MIVIWPAYIDSQKSRAEGRMVPKSIAVESPTADEIFEACKELEMAPVLEATKKMPSATWEKPGRVLINKKDKKLKLLREISLVLQRKRALRKKT